MKVRLQSKKKIILPFRFYTNESRCQRNLLRCRLRIRMSRNHHRSIWRPWDDALFSVFFPLDWNIRTKRTIVVNIKLVLIYFEECSKRRSYSKTRLHNLLFFLNGAEYVSRKNWIVSEINFFLYFYEKNKKIVLNVFNFTCILSSHSSFQ